MTTEEIDKAAKEHAQKAWRAYDSPPTHAIFETSNDFKAGADFVNGYWQEKTRWKSLETEPPKFEGKKYQILIRHSPITHDVACIVSSRSVEFCIAKGYKYWKEIE